MSKATKRKHVTREVLEGEVKLTDAQSIVKVFTLAESDHVDQHTACTIGKNFFSDMARLGRVWSGQQPPRGGIQPG